LLTTAALRAFAQMRCTANALLVQKEEQENGRKMQQALEQEQLKVASLQLKLAQCAPSAQQDMPAGSAVARRAERGAGGEESSGSEQANASAKEPGGPPALPPKPCWLAAGITGEGAAADAVRAAEVHGGDVERGVGCQARQIAMGRSAGTSAGQQGRQGAGTEKAREGWDMGAAHVRQGRAAVLSDVGGSGGTSGVMIPIGRLQIGRKRGFAAVPDAGRAAEGTAEGSELRVATEDMDCKRPRPCGDMSADAGGQDRALVAKGKGRKDEGGTHADSKGFSFFSPKWWSFS